MELLATLANKGGSASTSTGSGSLKTKPNKSSSSNHSGMGVSSSSMAIDPHEILDLDLGSDFDMSDASNTDDEQSPRTHSHEQPRDCSGPRAARADELLSESRSNTSEPIDVDSLPDSHMSAASTEKTCEVGGTTPCQDRATSGLVTAAVGTGEASDMNMTILANISKFL